MMKALRLLLTICCALALMPAGSSVNVINQYRFGTPPAYSHSATGTRDADGGALTTGSFTSVTGSLFIVCVTWDNTSSATMTVTDSKSNSPYTASALGKKTDVHNQSTELFYFANGAGGASHTFTATPSSNSPYVRVIAVEVTGAKTTSPEDTSAYGADTGTAITVGPITPATNNTYIAAFTMNDSVAGQTLAADSPWTERATASAGNYEMQYQDYQQTTAASISSNWTASTTGDVLSQMVAFKSP